MILLVSDYDHLSLGSSSFQIYILTSGPPKLAASAPPRFLPDGECNGSTVILLLDSETKILTHGQAAVAMITAILFQVMQLYRVCKFATEKTVLKVLLPQIEADQYFDDRLADTLDALFGCGIGDLDMLITSNMINAFKIESQLCHNDTTSVSTYGDADNNKTGQSIQVTFGHSKLAPTRRFACVGARLRGRGFKPRPWPKGTLSPLETPGLGDFASPKTPAQGVDSSPP